MQSTRIVIVGAGLSGLYAAYLLERQGISDYVLLEARDVLGGRIASINAMGDEIAHITPNLNGIDRFDLGPTWFWPGFQPELDRVIETLGIERFQQFETGDMLVERFQDACAVRMQGYVNSPPSMRLVGGMGALVEAIIGTLNLEKVFSNQAVHLLRKCNDHVEVESKDAAGHTTTWLAEHVLLALPPRLIENSITFEPALPDDLVKEWRATATWMAPHAKYIAIYDTPFWRDQQLSGEARSVRGPLGEIHDASMPGGSAALFGFLGVPASARIKVSDETLREHCRMQLARMFGPAALTPKAEHLKDWAQDPLTATAADVEVSSQHAKAPPSTASSGPWLRCLTGIASEWSPQFPGYLAGAIEAAELGVQGLTQHVAEPTCDLARN